jgi:hypothetical protein
MLTNDTGPLDVKVRYCKCSGLALEKQMVDLSFFPATPVNASTYISLTIMAMLEETVFNSRSTRDRFLSTLTAQTHIVCFYDTHRTMVSSFHA